MTEEILLDNSLDFMDRASQELRDAGLSEVQQLKYSTIHLWQGIELFLKYLLMREHWSLVIANMDKYKYGGLESGDFVSVDYDKAKSRLEDLLHYDIEKEASAFEPLKKLRNMFAHFTCHSERAYVTAIQLRAWHYLLEFVEQSDVDFSAIQESVFRQTKDKMLEHEDFIDTRFSELKPELELERTEGTLIVDCPYCNKSALVVDDGVTSCRVCATTFTSIINLSEDYSRNANPYWRHPKHGVDDDISWCGECDQKTVVLSSDEIRTMLNQTHITDVDLSYPEEPIYVCLQCGEIYLEHSRKKCEYCGDFSFVDEGNACLGCRR